MHEAIIVYKKLYFIALKVYYNFIIMRSSGLVLFVCAGLLLASISII